MDNIIIRKKFQLQLIRVALLGLIVFAVFYLLAPGGLYFFMFTAMVCAVMIAVYVHYENQIGKHKKFFKFLNWCLSSISGSSNTDRINNSYEVLMALPDGLFVINDKGEVICANPAAEYLFNYKTNLMLGLSVETFLPRAKCRNILPDNSTGTDMESFTAGVTYEEIAKQSDGSIFPVEINISRIDEMRGQTIITVRDITDRKLFEKHINNDNELLQKSNIELESFAYTAAHDLKDPLRKIEHFSKKLSLNGPPEDDAQSKYIDRIRYNSQRMIKLIDGLLNYAKCCTESCTFEVLSLEDLIDKLILEFKDTLDDIGADIELNNLPIIFGDEVKLKQLFRNLISNSIKYRCEQKKLSIKIFCNPKVFQSVKSTEGVIWHKLIYKDNGLGISNDKINNIFRPFTRGSKNESDGIGLGLSVCKKVIEMHHGTISAESEVGKGTIFEMNIPSCMTNSVTVKDVA